MAVDIVQGGCANAYVYLHGDPLNAKDLTGQAECGGSYTFGDSRITATVTFGAGPTSATKVVAISVGVNCPETGFDPRGIPVPPGGDCGTFSGGYFYITFSTGADSTGQRNTGRVLRL